MNRDLALERKLRKILTPVVPRKTYVTAAKRSFLTASRMPVEMEKPRGMAETVTFATLGLGAVATIAAVTAIGVKIVEVVSTGSILEDAAQRQRAKKPKPSLI
jgi:hypothetical protein